MKQVNNALPMLLQARQSSQLEEITNFRKNTIVLFGDSLTYQNGFSMNDATNSNSITDTGFFTWANTFLKQRFKVTKYSGVAGNTTAQALERIQEDVIDYKPAYCMVLLGTNDLRQDLDVEVTKSNLELIYTKLRNNGIYPIISTLFPDTATVTIAKWYALNEWIRNYALNNDVLFADMAKRTVNIANGLPLANTTWDGSVHTSAYGAILAGMELYNVLNPIIKNVDVLPIDNGDINILNQNPMMTGDTNGVSDYWSISGGTNTPSKVARTDGLIGYWQQIVGTTTTTMTMQTTNSVNVTEDEKYEVFVEIEVGNITSLKKLEVSISYLTSGGSFVKTHKVNTHVDAYPDIAVGNWGGIIKLEAESVPSALAIAKIKVRIDINCVGTVRIGRVILKKV